MPDRHNDKTPDSRSFLQRWSQRKLARRVPTPGNRPAPEVPQAQEQPTKRPDSQLPDVESLHEDSDIGAFLAEDVSEAIRRQALRKLFHFSKFNICDGLDDYAEDYTFFEPLDNLLAAKDKLDELGDKLNLQQNPQHDTDSNPSTDSTEVNDTPPEDEIHTQESEHKS